MSNTTLTAAHPMIAQFKTAADAKNWQIRFNQLNDYEMRIGIEMAPYCWTWFVALQLSSGTVYLHGDHTYSQNTGKTDASWSRKFAKERVLTNLGVNFHNSTTDEE